MSSSAQRRVDIDEIFERGLDQGEVATAPERRVSDLRDHIQTCAERSNPDERAAAEQRDALFKKWQWWFSKGRRLSRDLEIPLPVCFNRNWEILSVGGKNIVNFNNGLIGDKRLRNTVFSLTSYVSTDEFESLPGLGRVRGELIRSLTNSNVRGSFVMADSVSDTQYRARRVFFAKQGRVAVSRSGQD